VGFKRSRPLVMPAFGVIKGGRLDGWRFHFLHFAATPAELQVFARCSPPAWPFPCDIPLRPEHFGQLRAVAGERAKRLAVDPLIKQAYEAAGILVPWWATEQRMTLRARLRKSQERNYRRGTQ
jgi:hypothetical protein